MKKVNKKVEDIANLLLFMCKDRLSYLEELSTKIKLKNAEIYLKDFALDIYTNTIELKNISKEME